MKLLEDVTILDFTRVLAGPYCTLTLADLGARVVKIEPPDGDFSRSYGPFRKGVSAYFVSVNRGKQSAVINLKDPRGVELALQLAEKSDVLVENFRPGAMERRGLGYETVRKHREGEWWLVVCLELTTMGQASWYHSDECDTPEELQEELRSEFCYGKPVAVGKVPEWLKERDGLVSAVVPFSDGTVKTGIY